MNRNHEQRARRLAARIAALAVITLAPLAATAGPALADQVGATTVSNDSGDSFGDSYGRDSNGWDDNDHQAWDGDDFGDDDGFGWDDNGHYGYKDHHRQDYDGWEDHLNSGDNQYPDRDSHNDRHRDYDRPADWDRENPNPRGGGGAPPNWNMPNPYIPPPPPSLLPQVQLPVLPPLPFALPVLPGLPGTGSAR
ncbi:hypothetical protein [Nocardia testacea]|uniref:hypothetical protein n=1 Tax=Nocardia testacea TaxID=248551 RepID=UPI0033E017A8